MKWHNHILLLLHKSSWDRAGSSRCFSSSTWASVASAVNKVTLTWFSCVCGCVFVFVFVRCWAGKNRKEEREREINAAVVLCGAPRHFDESHSELTTPADSTLKPDWLERLQVRRMLMDMMWTTNRTQQCRLTQGHTWRNRSRTPTLRISGTQMQYEHTISPCLALCTSLSGQLYLMIQLPLWLTW